MNILDEEEKEHIADLVANAALELYDNEENAEQTAAFLFEELLFLSQINNKRQEKISFCLAWRVAKCRYYTVGKNARWNSRGF